MENFNSSKLKISIKKLILKRENFFVISKFSLIITNFVNRSIFQPWL